MLKEQATRSKMVTNTLAAITAAGTTSGAIIDTAGYSQGITFFMSAPVYTDGTYTLSFTEGDESDLSDGATVGSDEIVTFEDTDQDAVATGVSAVAAAGNVVQKAAIFSNKRYVQPVITATSVTTGATILLNQLMFPDVIEARS